MIKLKYRPGSSTVILVIGFEYYDGSEIVSFGDAESSW